MKTQPLTNSVMTFNFVLALPETKLPLESPIYAASRDYGFDFDEDELGRELLAPLPATSVAQVIPEVDADEFEGVFHHFIS